MIVAVSIMDLALLAILLLLREKMFFEEFTGECVGGAYEQSF